MKPHLLKVQLKTDRSFSIREDISNYFYDQWHYHPEIELLHIHKGTGSRFIGNKIENFKPDEILLIGSNLPHLFRSDKKFYRKDYKIKSEASVIHFSPSLFGETFYNLPENKLILKLLKKAKQGIKIIGVTKNKVTILIRQLFYSQGTDRLIQLLNILNVIATSGNNQLISSGSVDYSAEEEDNSRLNSIYQYIFTNFSRGITLEEIAKVGNFATHSFCRYFKARTKKRFSAFLLEVRVGHICKLLSETDKTVTEICYVSGFNNLSNFYRHFKNITGLTPVQYRKHHHED